MSMHDMEDFIEICVNKIIDSDLPVLRKRSLIRVAFEMESYGDCGFTQLRTIDKMVECNYTFLFDKKEMYNYKERKEFYDSLEDAPYESGDVYAYLSENHPEKNGLVCVDSGTTAYKEMVSRFRISGDGTVELEEINFCEAIKQIAPLVFDKNDKELQMLEKSFCFISSGLYMCAALTGIAEDFSEKDFIKIFGVDRGALEKKLGIE